MKIRKIQIFKLKIENFFLVPVDMGHGFAILIPFSISSRPKVAINPYLKAENQVYSKSCKMRNFAKYNFLNTPYVVAAYMGHGFAILIPFSISVPQKLLNRLSLQQKL